MTVKQENEKKAALTPEHLQALGEGRKEAKIVKRYLEELDAQRPKRGRKRTHESIKARLEAVETALPSASGVERLNLLQERVDLTSEMESLASTVEIGPLEDEFVGVASSYAARKGITYKVWREAGVPAAVLKRAGLVRNAQ